ncbi:MAG: hypothetical protein KAS74_07480, partial [Methanosarcinales archaeon]|nr:hypothetical protein [Methanosarcinales archaeon]
RYLAALDCQAGSGASHAGRGHAMRAGVMRASVLRDPPNTGVGGGRFATRGLRLVNRRAC